MRRQIDHGILADGEIGIAGELGEDSYAGDFNFKQR